MDACIRRFKKNIPVLFPVKEVTDDVSMANSDTTYHQPRTPVDEDTEEYETPAVSAATDSDPPKQIEIISIASSDADAPVTSSPGTTALTQMKVEGPFSTKKTKNTKSAKKKKKNDKSRDGTPSSDRIEVAKPDSPCLDDPGYYDECVSDDGMMGDSVMQVENQNSYDENDFPPVW